MNSETTESSMDSLEKHLDAIEMNTLELKQKLHDIINSEGECKENSNIFLSLTKLLYYNDKDIVKLSLEAIAELAKCDENRVKFTNTETIKAILNILKSNFTVDSIDLYEQVCRCLGNISCDCDEGRTSIINCDGPKIFRNFLDELINCNGDSESKLKLLSLKFLLNFSLGGAEYTKPLLENSFDDIIFKIVSKEFTKKSSEEDIVSTGLLLFNVFNENVPDLVYKPEINKLVLDILKEATDIGMSETCFEIFLMQAENDAVKTLLALEGAVDLLVSRIDLAVERKGQGDEEVNAVIKLACDLIILILTGDEAMQHVYGDGISPTYEKIVKWLESENDDIVTTSALAIGDFARTDQHCIQMMQDGMFDKLLEIFEIFHAFANNYYVRDVNAPPLSEMTISRFEHALLSALRNLSVPVANKKVIAEKGRAVPLLLRLITDVKFPNVAYKALATLRMLTDGQEPVCYAILCDEMALKSIVKWAEGGAGMSAEAPRLLARAATNCSYQRIALVKVEGCVECIVGMLLASHPIMQNEAVLVLTLLAVETISAKEHPYRQKYVDQLKKCEIGKHLGVLIETNLPKLPQEVALNILAFLETTVKEKALCEEYKAAKLDEFLMKLSEGRNDYSEDVKSALGKTVDVLRALE